MILFFTHLKLHFLHSSVHSKLSFVQMQKLRLMIVMWYDGDVQVRKLLLSLVVNPITDAVDLSPLSHRGIAGLEPEYVCVCPQWHKDDLHHFHLYLSVSLEAPPWGSTPLPVQTEKSWHTSDEHSSLLRSLRRNRWRLFKEKKKRTFGEERRSNEKSQKAKRQSRGKT